MKNYQNFKIFLTILLMWIGVQFSSVVGDSIAFFLILTIGLLHGANDVLILSLQEKSKQKTIQSLVIYLLVSAVCIGIFLLNSYLAILLFIMISSYHFGEEQLSDHIYLHKYFDVLYYTSFGLIVFNLLFLNSIEEVNTILIEMVNIRFTKLGILVSLMASFLLTASLSVYLLIKKKVSIATIGVELFYLVLLFFVFKSTSLILGFAIYFVFWHSFPSMIGQIQYISTIVDNKSTLFYVKKAAPFWLVSVLGLVLLFWIFPEINVFATFVFALLFAVTAPHIWVMYKMKH